MKQHATKRSSRVRVALPEPSTNDAHRDRFTSGTLPSLKNLFIVPKFMSDSIKFVSSVLNTHKRDVELASRRMLDMSVFLGMLPLLVHLHAVSLLRYHAANLQR